MCDQVIESYDEETKTIPANFNETKATCKTQKFYFLLALVLYNLGILKHFELRNQPRKIVKIYKDFEL